MPLAKPLCALTKLFGVTRARRIIHRSDFHLPIGTPPDDRTPKELFIDIVISLPELAKGSATADSVAPTFRHMHIDAPKPPPVCRVRPLFGAESPASSFLASPGYLSLVTAAHVANDFF
jgi:hypothetical protein